MTLGKYQQSAIPKPGRAVGGSALVLDGSEVKLRLMAERVECDTPVHVDWLRFTCLVRNVLPYQAFKGPASLSRSQVDHLPAFKSAKPGKGYDAADPYHWLSAPAQVLVMEKMIAANRADHVDAKFSRVFAQAHDLCTEVCDVLGPDFKVAGELKKGQDFYKHRLPIERNGCEVGWVGFLAANDGPRVKAQDSTIHVNLYGAACTFAAPGWAARMADIVDIHEGKITRADLALDFFDGYPGGLDRIKQDFDEGLCKSANGQRPKCNMVGDWSASPRDGRSFYWGSKEAGKQTNAYEKGHQLYGFDYGSAWLRIELRYGNKLRVLPSDLLRRPADFFAGASDWHASALALVPAVKASAQSVPVDAPLPVQTVKAECRRMLKWAVQTAGPSLAVLFKYATEAQFMDVIEHQKLPGRLQKFSGQEIAKALGAKVAKVKRAKRFGFDLVKDAGTEAIYSLIPSAWSCPAPSMS